MRKKPVPVKRLNKSTTVGLIFAGLSAYRSFQPSLLERDTLDQGIITGATVASNYGVSSLIQDVLDEFGSQVVEQNAKKRGTPPTKEEYFITSLAVSLLAYGAGTAIENVLPERNDDSLPKATINTAGRWLKYVGAIGSIANMLFLVAYMLDGKRSEKSTRIRRDIVTGLGVPVGILAARLLEKTLTDSPTQGDPEIGDIEYGDINIPKSALYGVVVAGVLGLIAVAERKVAKEVDERLAKHIPLLAKRSRFASHIAVMSLSVFGTYELMRRAYRKVEQGSENVDEIYVPQPTHAFVSGGAKSAISWGALTKESRRHLGNRLSAAEINTVMQTKSSKEPLRLYVGFNCAETEEERVTLALKELRKHKAYDRKYIAVISPTGTGYVNYQFSESLEYLSRGDVASIAVQYSLRPSPLSLDQVPEGHAQHRMLLNGIKKEIAKLPANKQPKILVFGESLGAWTSQDSFANQGTDGLEALNIHRALWIGTPYMSKWKDQVTGHKKRLDTDYDMIGKFNDIDELMELSPAKRKQLRYVMLTHYNDPVALFSASIIIKRPGWLNDAEGLRPKGISKKIQYGPFVSFYQTLIDMKNALKPVPGQLQAKGHDYSADLAAFVNHVFSFNEPDEVVDRINDHLAKNDLERAKKLGLL